MNVDKPIDLFCSYAHADAKLQDKLDKHLILLKRQGLIKPWSHCDVSAGTDWSRQIDHHLNEARIILLLISPDYLEDHSNEMTRALERHEAGEARVIPILLQPVDWKNAPFAHLKAIPRNGKPVTAWSDKNQAFENIAKELRRVVEELSIADQKVHPRNEEPVTRSPDPDQAVKDAVEGPHQVVEELSIADQKVHPRNEGPVIILLNPHQAFGDIAKGIRGVLRELQERDIVRKILRWVYTSIIIVIHKIADALRRWVESNRDVGRKIPRWVSLSLVGMMAIMLPFGSVWGLVSLPPKPPDNLFPPLCSGSFRSANMPTKTDMGEPLLTQTPSNGDLIGLSEGATVFDRNRSDFQDKHQAAQDWRNNPQGVVSSLQNALKSDQTDAEAQIYLENWTVLGYGRPYITFVVGVSFSSSPPGGSPVDYNGSSRSILQGAFIAQKECNDQNRKDTSKALVVLMIANTGQNLQGDNGVSAQLVANQIVDRTHQDPTIVGIMGWIYSPDSITVNHQLRKSTSDLPMLSPSSSADELEGRSNFFRIGHKNSDLVQMAAQFMLNEKQKKRFALLYDQANAYGNNLKDDFANSLPISHLVSTEAYTGGDAKQIKDALTKELAQKPDAIFFAGYEGDLVTFLEDLSQTSSKNVLVVSAPALSDTSDLLKPLSGLQNVYFPTSSSPKAWDGIHPKPSFFQEYKDHFGMLMAPPTGLPSIDADVIGGYDALLTLLDASQKVLSGQQPLTSSNLTKELRKITITGPLQGISGRIAFDGNGDQDQHKVMFMEHIEGTNLVIDKRQGCFLVTRPCYN